MAAKCGHCGVNIPPENKFCANCGKPVNRTSTATEAADTTHQAPTPYPITPSSRLSAAFWLGLVGAIFGLLIGTFYVDVSLFGVIIFSTLGIIGPLRLIDSGDKLIAGLFWINGDTINAGLMIIAGIGMLISAYQIGILSALFFFIGGALIDLKKG
jgi:zinc-ribbon domain